MSPKFYSFLWVFYFAAAGIMWLAGVLTMLALVAFGFVAFGLVFIGMMCVLPGMVSHPTPEKATTAKPKQAFKSTQAKPAKVVSELSTYRSA